MKALEDLDHYELLEIPRSAGGEEVERAFRMAYAAYEPDSLAMYSVFDERDALSIRERLQVAYRTLSNDSSRRRYDATIAESERVEGEIESAAADVLASEIPELEALGDFEERAFSEAIVDLPASTPEAAAAEHSPSENRAAIQGDVTGEALRVCRERLGLGLDRIADTTKISPSYLRFIEEERFDDLPAPVYVRGFVVAYAEAMGLPASEVVGGYMARLEETRGRRRRGRLLPSR